MSEIIKCKSISVTDRKLKVAVYGGAGCGKTTLASTFPNVCFVDMNNGLLSIRNSDASFIKCHAPKEPSGKWMLSIQDAINTIDKDDSIESIAIDGMSEVSTAMMQFVKFKRSMPVDGKPDFEDWRIYFNMLEKFITSILTMDKHSIFLAHQVIDKDENMGRIMAYPAIVGQMKNKFSSYFDEYYHAEVVMSSNEYKYRLQARPNSIYEAKSRLLNDPKVTFIENPSFASIFKLLMG